MVAFYCLSHVRTSEAGCVEGDCDFGFVTSVSHSEARTVT